MSEESSKNKSLWGCFVVGMVLVGILILAFSIFYFTIWQVPDNSAQAKKERERIQQNFHQAYSLADKDNGFLVYEKASSYVNIESIEINNEDMSVPIENYLENPLTSAHIPLLEALKQRNEVAITLSEIAYFTDHGQVKIDYQQGFSAKFPDFLKLRRLAQLLTIMGKLEAMNQNYPSSAKYFLMVLKLGEDLSHTPHSLLQPMIGVAVERIALKQFISMLAESNQSPQFYEEISVQLERIYSKHPSFIECLDGEFFKTEWDLDTLYKANNKKNYFVGLIVNRLILERERRIYQNWYLEVRNIVVSERFSSAYKKLISTNQKITKFSIIARMLVSNIDRGYLQFCWTDSMVGGLKLLTALKRYEAEKGDYPDSLDSLVPDYISSLPVDPFPDDGKYKYVKTGDGVILYSIGYDLKDDGGTRKTENIEQSGDIIFLQEKISGTR